MKIDGAIIKEQGIVFGIIIVKNHVLSSLKTADETRKAFQSHFLEFSKIPLILASKDARGRFRYQGRSDIVDFLAKIDPTRIPWKTYTYL